MGSRFEFCDFQFDARTGELKDHQGTLTLLRPKTAALLEYFLTHANEPLSRECLLERIWDEEIVAGHNLTQSISELRKALGENGRGTRFIKTIPKKGYLWLEAPKQADVVSIPSTGKQPSGSRNSLKKNRYRATGRFAIIAAALLLLFAGIYYFRHFPGAARKESSARPLRVALLPIANETGDPSLNWVRFGLLEMAVQYMEMTNMVSPMQPPDIIRFWNAAATGSVMELSEHDLNELLGGFDMDVVLCLGFYQNKGERPYRLEVRKHKADGQKQKWTFPLRSPFDLLTTLPLTLRSGEPDTDRWPMPDEIFPGDDYVNRTLLWGLHYFRLRDFQSAEPFFEVTLQLAPEFAPAKLRLAGCRRGMGKFSEAEALVDEVLADKNVHTNPTLHARALNEKGSLELKKGNHDEGLCFLLESLEIAEARLGPFEQAGILTTLGSSFYLPEHLDQAREWQLRALVIGDQWSLPCPIFSNLCNLGNGFSLLNDMETAMVYWSEAFRQSVLLGTQSEIATLMNNMAKVAYMDGDLLLAEQMCQDSYSIRNQHGDTINASSTLLNLFHIYRADGRLELARKVLKEALGAFRKLEYPSGLLDCYYLLGMDAREQGDWDTARTHLKKALEVAQSMDHQPGIESLRKVLAETPPPTVHGTAVTDREFR